MKKPIESEHWYFVDESGDPVFYDRQGNLIIGQEGCSPIFIVGFMETADPHSIRLALNDLHARLALNEYLGDIPSMKKTNIAFHAKDDSPEVRQAVFETLRLMDFKAQFVVARKRERIFRNSFHSNESEFYDYLISLGSLGIGVVYRQMWGGLAIRLTPNTRYAGLSRQIPKSLSLLFENVLHRYTHNRVYISQRGTRLRQERLEKAVMSGISNFENRWKQKITTTTQVFPHTAVGEPCLQVIDYMNWAVYRAFVKREMRYFRFIQDKVSLLVDRYDSAKYPKNWYGRNNLFDIEKASPL